MPYHHELSALEEAVSVELGPGMLFSDDDEFTTAALEPAPTAAGCSSFSSFSASGAATVGGSFRGASLSWEIGAGAGPA